MKLNQIMGLRDKINFSRAKKIYLKEDLGEIKILTKINFNNSINRFSNP